MKKTGKMPVFLNQNRLILLFLFLIVSFYFVYFHFVSSYRIRTIPHQDIRNPDACHFSAFFILQTVCVIVPIGQKVHHVLGLYNTMTNSPISVDVSIKL